MFAKSHQNFCKRNRVKGRREEEQVKDLLAQLRKVNPQVDINIFRSAENVNLETIIGYRKGDTYTSFLDEYN